MGFLSQNVNISWWSERVSTNTTFSDQTMTLFMWNTQISYTKHTKCQEEGEAGKQGAGSGSGFKFCPRTHWRFLGMSVLSGIMFLLWKIRRLNEYLGGPFCSPQGVTIWLQDRTSERFLHSFSLLGQNCLVWPWLAMWVPHSLSGIHMHSNWHPVTLSTLFTLLERWYSHSLMN